MSSSAGETAVHPYTIQIRYSDEDGGFVAVVVELPGCMALGETEEAAVSEVREAMAEWFEIRSGCEEWHINGPGHPHWFDPP